MTVTPLALISLRLILWIVAFTGSSAVADVISCQFEVMLGKVVRTGYVKKTTVAHSKLDCILSSCGCVGNCIVSFNAVAHQCRSSLMGLALVHLSGGSVLDSDPSGAWSSYGHTHFGTVWRPSLLWLLDSEMKATNLGVLGSQLPASGESSVSWNASGPRGTSQPSTFATFSSSSALRVSLITPNGSHYLRLSKSGFTLAAWVKVNRFDLSKSSPLIEFREGSPRSISFWFHPSTDMDQLWMAVWAARLQYISTINNTGVEFWRHVAAVYDDTNKGRFYLNGSIWSASAGDNITNEVQPTTEVDIGYRRNTPLYFPGSMACACVYETALTAGEIVSLMRSCP